MNETPRYKQSPHRRTGVLTAGVVALTTLLGCANHVEVESNPSVATDDPLRRADLIDDTAHNVMSIIGSVQCNPDFSDVPKDSSLCDAAKTLQARGANIGFADGTLKPGQFINRAQAAHIVTTALGLPQTNDPCLEDIPDVSEEQFYAGSFAGLCRVGVDVSNENGTGDPNGNLKETPWETWQSGINNYLEPKLTRADLVEMTAEVVLGLHTPFDIKCTPLFDDIEPNSVTCDAVTTLANEGLIDLSSPKFFPNNNVPNAEVAAFLAQAGNIPDGVYPGCKDQWYCAPAGGLYEKGYLPAGVDFTAPPDRKSAYQIGWRESIGEQK